jgi:DNA modification methylase
MQIETLRVDALIPYARNSRTHSDAQVAQIAASIREFGFTNPVLIDAGGGIIAGHGRVMAARLLGRADVPCIRLGHLTEAQRRAYVIADNRLALNAGWDEAMLALELRDLAAEGFDVGLTGFDTKEIDALLASLDATPKGNTDPDATPPVQAEAVTRPGDVWVMGKHRIMCGDSTVTEQVQKLLGGGSVDLICTDPPYCSGGFQESGKSSGSVGTSATHKMVANDTLSTRGYTALLKAAFSQLGAQYLYAFTDWRMWVYLFDIAESSGFGARSMIVWDKGTPGMGRGWRAQHELVLWGCKKTPPFDKHAPSVGNVLQSKRTGNIHHTTEKPVEIMAALIGNAPFVESVADPFNGSGTTLIACEQIGKRYFGMEMDALYCDVAVRRWQQFTGKTAVLESTGAAFPG